MGGGDQGEGVGILQQGIGVRVVVEKLDRRETDADFAAEEFIAEGVGLPVLAVVSEYGQCGDGTAVFVVEAVVVGEEAFGEVAFVAALDFDVDVDPLLAAVVGGDLDQFVDEAFAEFGVFDDLGEFLVEEGVAAAPFDLLMRLGEVEGHEFGEVAGDGVFPGGVVVVGGWGAGLGHGWVSGRFGVQAGEALLLCGAVCCVAPASLPAGVGL